MPRKTTATNARSELIALRVTPKMRLGIELLARKHNRTMTEIVIWCIDNMFKTEQVGLLLFPEHEEMAVYVLDRVWSEKSHEVFARLGLYFPELLSDRELAVWQTVRETKKYWTTDAAPNKRSPGDFDMGQFEKDWKTLEKRIE